MAKRKPREPNHAEKLLQTMLGICHTNGTAVLERFQCENPDCRQLQMVPHAFRESICCVVCGNRGKSRSPRPIGKGEVTADHFCESIQIVSSAYSEDIFGEDGGFKVNELPVEFRGPVTARIAASVRNAIENVLLGAHSMAKTSQ